MIPNATSYLLTGDIGGTNSRMGLYVVGNNTPLAVVTYRNVDHLTKKEDGIFTRKIIMPFLKHCWETVPNMHPIELSDIIACLAVAGPVKQNKVVMSNLHKIEICGDSIVGNRDDCGSEGNCYIQSVTVCKIINDFVAQGYGCLTLSEDEIVQLTPNALSKIDPSGPKACVGAGTGLGECFLTPDEHGHYSCFPSEGGHVEWAPRTDLEIKMLKFLKNRFASKSRISVERVVSGTGLSNCYDFMALEFPSKINKTIHEEITNAGDLKGKSIAMGAKSCELCQLAMETMITSYGSEVGSVAIKLIPTGGLYVTGGLTPKNIKWIEGKDSNFMQAYFDKGRVSPILDNVPLFAVMVEDLGVRGARKNAELEHEKFEARKVAILTRENESRSPAAPTANKSSDPLEERLRKIEKDAANSRKLSQIVVGLAVCIAAGMALVKAK
jgi:glucokinase